jgi:hypothetical protein
MIITFVPSIVISKSTIAMFFSSICPIIIAIYYWVAKTAAGNV